MIDEQIQCVKDEILGEIARFDQTLATHLRPLLGPLSSKDYETALEAVEDLLLARIESGADDAPHQLFWRTDSHGLAIKEMHVGPGTLVIGKRHIVEHINMLVEGRVLLFTRDGPIALVAPFQFYSEAGGRKLGLFIDRSVFANVFFNPTNETDTGVLESLYMEESARFLGHKKIMAAKTSYNKLLDDYGVSDSEVRAVMDNLPEPVKNEDIDSLLELRASPIEGLGLFAKIDISKGYEMPLVVNGNRTLLARFANHSNSPNVEGNLTTEGAVAIALSQIKQGDEITMDYNLNIAISKIDIKKEVACLGGQQEPL